jgi:pimeloyl-ACP methyl ester carboxylesterase
MLRRLLEWAGIAIAGLVLLVLVLALVPASTPEIEGENAIASLEPVQIGGVEQWLLVRGQDTTRPVLLYLHGGPGSAFMPMAREFSSRLEEHFVVVHWDQRGAGKSCSSDVPNESLRVEQYLADTLELVNLLRERFDVEKIYLLGHSWGSGLGVLTVQAHPELFHAYVGLGQIVNMRRNEEISYEFVVEQARAEGNQEALDALAKIHPPYPSIEELGIQRQWLGHYRGDFHAGGGIARLAGLTMSADEYTLADKLFYLPCMFNVVQHAWHEIQPLDFLRDVRRLEVPVYLFTGRHDYNTPFELVEEWAANLQAPHVEIVWFEESAHMACLEEPERFQSELIDRVLMGTQP